MSTDSVENKIKKKISHCDKAKRNNRVMGTFSG